METEAVQQAAQAADLLIAWVVLTGLTIVAVFAMAQSNTMWNMCYKAYHWSKDAVSSKYDVQDFHEDMVDIGNKNKRVPAQAICVMIINMLLLYAVKSGEVSFMLKILTAGVNAHLIVMVYSTAVKMGRITRFISAVETEAALREMRRTEVKEEEK